MTDGRYLTHRPAAVLRDMKLLGDVPVVRLVDANTFGDLENALCLGQCIIESGLKKAIVADVRAETVTRHPDLFRLWKQAGLASVVIGFEEISDAGLERLNKRSSVAATSRPSAYSRNWASVSSAISSWLRNTPKRISMPWSALWRRMPSTCRCRRS